MFAQLLVVLLVLFALSLIGACISWLPILTYSRPRSRGYIYFYIVNNAYAAVFVMIASCKVLTMLLNGQMRASPLVIAFELVTLAVVAVLVFLIYKYVKMLLV